MLCDGGTSPPATADDGAAGTVPPKDQGPRPSGKRRRQTRGAGALPQAAAEVVPAGQVAVPQVVPIFPRRRRAMPVVSVTEGGAVDESFRLSDRVGGGPTSSARRTEQLTVNYKGGGKLEEDVRYHTYAMFRHGKRQVVTESVGYNVRGDFVVQKSEKAQLTSTNRAVRKHVSVDHAVCLDPKSKTEVSSDDDPSGPTRLERRYPGVKCPKNQRTRNRLINDHFASASAHPLREATMDGRHDHINDDVTATPAFGPIPSTLRRILDIEDDDQDKLLSTFQLTPAACPVMSSQQPLVAGTMDVNSAHWRFSQLPAKIRSELRHAMETDFMPGFIQDIEEKCAALIRTAAAAAQGELQAAGGTKAAGGSRRASPEPRGASSATVGIDTTSHPPATGTPTTAARDIELQCRDGYGRLMCHGVAMYYHLQSKSASRTTAPPPACAIASDPQLDAATARQTSSKPARAAAAGEERFTTISLPKKRVPALPAAPLTSFLRAGGGRSPMPQGFALIGVSPLPPPGLEEGSLLTTSGLSPGIGPIVAPLSAPPSRKGIFSSSAAAASPAVAGDDDGGLSPQSPTTDDEAPLRKLRFRKPTAVFSTPLRFS